MIGGCDNPDSTAAENSQYQVDMAKVATDQARTDAASEAERANAMR
jgi:hypothetical protein